MTADSSQIADTELLPAGRRDQVAAAVLLLAPILIVLGFLVGAVTGELDPFASDELEELLRTIHDSATLYAVSLAPFVLADAVVIPAAAALLYLSFRDRSQTLAIIGAFGLLTAAPIFVAHDTGAITLAFLAEDFVEGGGPGGVAAGDAVILQSARAVSIFQALAALAGQTAMGLGITSFGALLAWAPPGDRNPPRWFGIVGVIGGIALLCTWAFLLNHTVGGIITLAAELAAITMFVALGVWFFRKPERT